MQNIPIHKIEEKKLFIKWRDIKIEPGVMEQAHRHNYLQFMFLEKVQGVHEIDFETHKAENKSLHFVGKGRVHKVEFNSNIIGGVFLFPEELFSFSEPDMNLLHSLNYFHGGSYPIVRLKDVEFDQTKSLIDSLKESILKNPLEISKYLLFALLAEVREMYNNQALNNFTTGVNKLNSDILMFNNLLQQHATKWNVVEDFVKEMPVTLNRLNQLCKKQYGKTALRLLHERKLLAAKRLLVYTDKQVKEIAFDCGFEDVAYFNRFFKKFTSCTPLQFRNNH